MAGFRKISIDFQIFCAKCKNWKNQEKFEFVINGQILVKNTKFCIDCLKKEIEKAILKNLTKQCQICGSKMSFKKHQKYCKNCKKEAKKEYLNDYVLYCYNNDIKFRLDMVMSCEIRHSLKHKKAGRKWETLVGYTVEDLMKYLESKFTPEMNWNNYGIYWEIDHIIPKSYFKYESPEDEEFKKCWSLENLQPLPKEINRKKGNKISEKYTQNYA
jgi:hypothetical protein